MNTSAIRPRSKSADYIRSRIMSSSSDPPKLEPDAAESAPSAPLPANVRVWKSEELLDGQTEVAILHDGQYYRLRCTRQGKLILYK